MQKSMIQNIAIKARDLSAKAKNVLSRLVAMLKTKEGRDAIITKARASAIIAKDRTLTLWKSGIKGKVAICAASLLIVWLCAPSCGDSGKNNGTTAGKALVKFKMKKLRNTDALFYEGAFPQGTSGIEFKDDYNAEGLYKSVSPNIIVLPDSISLSNLCGIFNPEMEDLRKRGTSYLNNADGVYYCEVVHVGRGHVIVKPNSTSMYGDFYGYIETDDKYVEGSRLETGFYTYLGTTKTVPLANGSSRTMYAFSQVDAKTTAELTKAIEYNGDAVEAAKTENVGRSKACRELKAETDAKFDEGIDAGTDEIFRKVLASYDSEEWKTRIHIAKYLKGKVKFSDGAKWQWMSNGEAEEMSFADFKRKLEKEGGARFLESNDFYFSTMKKNGNGPTFGSMRDYVLESANKTLKARKYILNIEDGGSLMCYKIEIDSQGGCTVIPATSEWDFTFQLYNPMPPFEKENPSVHFYIVDPKKDADIKSAYDRFGNSKKTADTIINLFEKKYGK